MLKSNKTGVTGIAAALAMSVVLSGCSGNAPNPLATATTDTAAQFLVSANQAATKELKLGWGSYGYQQCMDGKHSVSKCNALYKGMVRYAKHSHNRLFRSLTFAQLTDASVWKSLSGAYEEAAFETLGN